MKKILAILLWATFLLTGCNNFRFAPTETQKQNAWLHNRTAITVAETAKTENASEKLQALTRLSELQSRASASYYGLPKEFPQSDTIDDLLAESNFQLANTALNESTERPNAWRLADNLLELSIGLCALLGGVYGTRIAWFLKQARAKSQALQEIVSGNELFKRNNAEVSKQFKEAHAAQSPQTRQIVTQAKTAGLTG